MPYSTTGFEEKETQKPVFYAWKGKKNNNKKKRPFFCLEAKFLCVGFFSLLLYFDPRSYKSSTCRGLFSGDVIFQGPVRASASEKEMIIYKCFYLLQKKKPHRKSEIVTELSKNTSIFKISIQFYDINLSLTVT